MSPTALLVIGMHRSGTSAFTRVLNLLGAALPDRLMPPAPSNEAGFWESSSLIAIHDDVLSSAGSFWDDVRAFPRSWFASDAAAIFRGRIVCVLRDELSNCPLFAIKDPRMCRLMPLWVAALNEFGAEPRVVLPIRHPLEVAASLQYRNHFSISKSLVLWLRHVLAAESDTRTLPRVFVGYENLLENWRAVAERIARDLSIRWPCSLDAERDIETFLSSGQRHHRSRDGAIDGDGEVWGWVQTAYEWMQAATRGDWRPVDVLDELAARLDTADQFYGALLVENHDSLARAEADRDRLTQRLGTAHDEQHEVIQQLQEALLKKDSEIAAVRRRLEEGNRSLSEVRGQLIAMEETVGWRALEKLRRARDRLLPEGTARRMFYAMARRILGGSPREAAATAVGEARSTTSHAGTRAIAEEPGSAADAGNLRLLGIGESASANQDVGDGSGVCGGSHTDGDPPHVAFLSEMYEEASEEYQPFVEKPVEDSSVKLIAFYLPQFHPIPENDQWWGRGFTEWTNVSRAKPQFVGHYQPRLPGELGFYDLRISEVQARQIELAKHYGIYGFCYHYYWFNGIRLLYQPLKQLLEAQELDQPFCVCWANENWTRRWDGQERDILIAQEHSAEADLAFIRDVEHLFRDPRYIRVDEKPLLLVYRPDILPDAYGTVERWRHWCHEVGIGDVFLVAARTFGLEDPRPLGFDAAVEFPPHGCLPPKVVGKVKFLNRAFGGALYRYEDLVRNALSLQPPDYTLFRGVIPDWDNTPRRGAAGTVFWGSSPRLYQEWLEGACEYTTVQLPASMRFVFVNAWNEWAEGAYLEPDRRYGYAYLNSTAAALRKQTIRPRAGRSRRPRISVVLPAYNHQAYVSEALDSVVRQSWSDLEIIVVDDGSRDGTGKVAREFAASHPDYDIEIVGQANAGAHAAINRGVELARGDFIAILNSDDFYHPLRLATLYRELETSGSLLAFSGIEVVDEKGMPVPTGNAYADLLRTKAADIRSYPNLGYALLDFNIGVTTGNLVFRRELFDMVGGFRELKYCHDWDFLLGALRYTNPRFVEERLYFYRLHSGNTFASLQAFAESDTASVLGRFFEQRDDGLRVGVPSPRLDREYFDAFVRARGYQRYLSPFAVPESNRAEAAVSSDKPYPGSNECWYGDGWVAPVLRLLLRRDGNALRLRGRLPESYANLRGQVLEVDVNRRLAARYEVASGPFDFAIPVMDRVSPVELEVRASRWFIPMVDLKNNKDSRQLAYLLDEVRWDDTQ